MTTPRERSQRYRRKCERAKGKPKLGRPRGSRNVRSSISQIMKWYEALRKQGHSDTVAIAAIRNQLGVPLTELMVRNWQDMTQRNTQRKPRYDLTPYRAVRSV